MTLAQKLARLRKKQGMSRSYVMFHLLGAIISALGMGWFLLIAETTVRNRVIAVSCCLIALVLFIVGERRRK